jgi:uncharacterized protein YjbJ (UPF0337 family)
MLPDHLQIFGISILSGTLALSAQTFSPSSFVSSSQASPTVLSQSIDEPLLLAMNEDQFKGKWAQFKGELKRQWGKITDDDLMQIEGSYEKFRGKVQERYGEQKEAVEQWTDDWYEKTGAKQPRKRSE